jgi:hypothetical protein
VRGRGEDHCAAISAGDCRLDLEAAFSLVPQVFPGKFEQFCRHLDPDWIEDALVATGTATIRRRRLPAEQTLWLVIGMAMMRDESIERVASLLNVALPSRSGNLAARSALTQARQRLGADPFEYLFSLTAIEWATRGATAYPWLGLSVLVMDGTTLRVPDSAETWAAFGGQSGNGARAGSAYPTVRVLGLIAARSHVLRAMKFAPYDVGEVTLARQLWDDLPDNSVTILDRNFLLGADLSQLAGDGRNRHWLCRAKVKTKLKVLERLSKDDALAEVVFGDSTRRHNKGLPERWVVRAIKYQRKGFPPSTLLTSLTDALKYPRAKVVALYHERWEIELGYDELKTHMLRREEAIRSRTSGGIRQELWAIGLAYNLVRVEMERAADEAGVPPTRISFVNTLSLLCHAWIVWSTPPLAPGRIPSALLDLRSRIRLLLLPARRPERRYPRVVKIKMSAYNKKWVNRPPRK